MITLTYNGTTATLPDDLDWTDEYSWHPVEQSTGYSTTGALLIDVGLKQAGRPITLQGSDTSAWISRALCDTLVAWAALPGITLTLTLRGTARSVVFDHARTAFDARPLIFFADGHTQSGDQMVPTLRFLET